MARSLLKALVSGTRQMLTTQLVISICAIALAGWTLAVTSNVIRERNQLRERVIQLETAMGSQGIIVPATPATVDQGAPAVVANAYPPAVGSVQRSQSRISVVSPAQQRDAATLAARGFDPTRIISEIFTPPPPVRALVLHVRGPGDAQVAQRVARGMRDANVGVTIDVLAAHDQRQPGYAYFDGRQSHAAAALVSLFNDAARRAAIAPWSAQLPGVALPAQGQYTDDRLDIVLPALPAPTPVQIPTPAANPPG